MSQWSLTFEVRKRPILYLAGPISGTSQWSLTFEVRKRSPDRDPTWCDDWSQWSLTFEVRKREEGYFAKARVNEVAMEPDL